MPKREVRERIDIIIKVQNTILFLGIVLVSLILSVYFLLLKNFDLRSRAQIQDPSSIKLRTLTIPPISITITYPPTPTNLPYSTNPPYATNPPYIPNISGPSRSPQSLITGGPVNPDAPYYCIDDEDPDSCDDNTAFWVPKGTGGKGGTCGAVIEWGHKLVNSLPHFMKGTRDSLNPQISSPSCNYSTGTYSGGYISTFFVIDAYNLAGFHELSKSEPSHVSGSNLLNWWQSTAASQVGYNFIPYTSTTLSQHSSGQQDLTGCVVFLNLNSGVHVGLFNVLEVVNGQGDGIMSILQSGVSFYIDRFEVVGWNVMNTPLHKTQLSSVTGFGCHQ